jgi:hypothetical protein
MARSFEAAVAGAVGPATSGGFNVNRALPTPLQRLR